MRPHKKSLGQYFLRNRNILRKIADAAELTADDTVLEVGPGEGTLTEFLLARAGKVVAVEKDARLIPVLQQKFSTEIASGRLALVHDDILAENDTRCCGLQTSGVGQWKVVANLPYYITGQFLRKFLQSEAQPNMMVLLLQKEVVKRIIAADGKESILSISVKCYGAPEYVDTVKAGSFSPPPKVDSAILKIRDISKKFFKNPPHENDTRYFPPPRRVAEEATKSGIESEESFFALLKKGFAHPRKLLASNLRVAKEILVKYGIPENARAEDVSLVQWRRLVND